MKPEEELPLGKVAKRFNVSAKTIKNWIETLGFPKPHYHGRTPFFKALEVVIWQKQQHKNTDPPAEGGPGRPKK